MEHPHPRLGIKVPHTVKAILQLYVPLKKRKEKRVHTKGIYTTFPASAHKRHVKKSERIYQVRRWVKTKHRMIENSRYHGRDKKFEVEIVYIEIELTLIGSFLFVGKVEYFLTF